MDTIKIYGETYAVIYVGSGRWQVCSIPISHWDDPVGSGKSMKAAINDARRKLKPKRNPHGT